MLISHLGNLGARWGDMTLHPFEGCEYACEYEFRVLKRVRECMFRRDGMKRDGQCVCMTGREEVYKEDRMGADIEMDRKVKLRRVLCRNLIVFFNFICKIKQRIKPPPEQTPCLPTPLQKHPHPHPQPCHQPHKPTLRPSSRQARPRRRKQFSLNFSIGKVCQLQNIPSTYSYCTVLTPVPSGGRTSKEGKKAGR